MTSTVYRVLGYTRVSTNQEKRKYSPETQNKGFRRFVDERDWIAVEEPTQDLDMSGRDFAKRSIKDLIDRVRNGEADGIVVYKINRWGRNAAACMAYLKELEEAGGRLYSTKEVIDTSTSAGRKAIRDAFSDAEYESDVIGDHWKDTHHDSWAAGLPHSGREQFGYRRCPDCRRRKDKKRAYEYCETCERVLQEDDRTVENTEGESTREPRGKALVEVYKRLLSGESMHSIVVDMNKRGVTSLQHKPMDAQSWYRALDTGFAAGYLRRKSESQKEKTTSHKPEDYDDWKKGKHSPLIDEDTWVKYKELRAKRQKQNHFNQKSKAFSGLLKCYRESDGKPCGGVMVSYTMRSTSNGKDRKKTTIPAYRCSNFVRGLPCSGLSVTERRVEKEILNWLGEKANPAESMDEKIRRAAETLRARTLAVTEIEQQLKRLIDRQEEFKNLYTDPDLDSGLSPEEYRDTLKRFSNSLDRKRHELEEAKKAKAQSQAPVEPSVFGNIHMQWTRVSADRKRQMLNEVIDRIEIRPRTEGEKFSSVLVIGIGDAS